MFQGTFQPTAEKTRALRIGEEITNGSDSGMAMKPGPNGAPVPSLISFTIKIKEPGQKKGSSG
jgi:hypothetical protein